MDIKQIGTLLKQTFDDWNGDKAPQQAAALAYYTIFSLAPLLVIAIAIAGLFFGRDGVEGQVFDQLKGFLGQSGAEAVQTMIKSASAPASGIVATIIGVVTLLFGAAGFFGQLQDSLNTIWEVKVKPNQPIMAIIKQRFFSFSMVLSTGFLLLVSLLLSAVLAAITGYFSGIISGADWVWELLNFVISLGITIGLFGLIFKYVPDVKIAWRDVWPGAILTGVLFSVGRFILAQYLGRGTFSSTYGAAGSLVVVLLWVYYSAQIMFFGAEFAQIFAKHRGSKIVPAENAQALPDSERAALGLGGAADEPSDTPTVVRKGGAIATLTGFVVGVVLGQRRSQKKE